MKQSWNIYSGDLKRTVANWVALIIIGGLVFLPSLYAWFNIKASWDPYGNTDQIPVGIVNEDQGATVQDRDINAGDELVQTLKKNDSLNWHFDNRKTAMDKVEYGDYFAVIIVPEDFSEKLSTVVGGTPEKSTMEYYVNDKLNAIAPKITDKGAGAIVDKLSSQFIATVNGVIFDMFNELGVEIEDKLPDIKNFEDYVFTMEEELPQIYELIEEGLDEAGSAQGIIHDVQNRIPEAKQASGKGLQTINNTTAMLNKAEEKLDQLAPKIESDLEKAQTTAKDVNDFLSDLNGLDIDYSKQEELKKQIDQRVTEAIAQLDEVEQALDRLGELNDQQNSVGSGEEGDESGETDRQPESTPSQEEIQAILDRAAADVATLKEALQEIQNNTRSLDEFVTKKRDEVDEVLANLQELSAKTENRIGKFLKAYKNDIQPAVKENIRSAKSTLITGRDILQDIQKTIPQVESVLGNADSTLADGEDMLQKVKKEYPYINTKINELADRIREVQGQTDVNEIISLLQNDPEAESSFFEEPVQLNKNELFPIANYGSGMTPFYTVLAIWVGGLLLISLLATDVHDPSLYTVKERYFGKLFTFLTIGALQTIIVTSGDLWLLNVDVVHPAWFILFGLFISIIFISIIYTVVTILGDVGKAAVIIMLVLQIAGAGGTYPVVLLPEFFQVISPFLPFTYAIDLMREALGGIVWDRALRDIAALSLFGSVFIVVGTWLKKPINKHTDKLASKSKESGMFH
ncbi:Phage infection protein [Lentibacillus sp. JNUCC-1]|uniref:YhgE/Pip domain-containing protein n=1 Tax=Lentibacillus sp. JNUCC-1 TaxID=2654513 RepID=UPI0012E8F163|nr:YhgE/Pip domain-containing protein [Lentibacillus sp. JNUCC-1]MUV36471.1 Phage infection protein [Lentibacillus sp. JNUCC-1]